MPRQVRVVSTDTEFEIIERPSLDTKRQRKVSPLVQAVIDTATTKQALKVPLKSRTPGMPPPTVEQMARSLTTSARSRGYRVVCRPLGTDAVAVWAEPLTDTTTPATTTRTIHEEVLA